MFADKKTKTHKDFTTNESMFFRTTLIVDHSSNKMRAHQKLCCGLSVLSRRCHWGRKWLEMTGDCRRLGQSGSCGQNQYQMDWTGPYWTGGAQILVTYTAQSAQGSKVKFLDKWWVLMPYIDMDWATTVHSSLNISIMKVKEFLTIFSAHDTLCEIWLQPLVHPGTGQHPAFSKVTGTEVLFLRKTLK